MRRQPVQPEACVTRTLARPSGGHCGQFRPAAADAERFALTGDNLGLDHPLLPIGVASFERQNTVEVLHGRKAGLEPSPSPKPIGITWIQQSWPRRVILMQLPLEAKQAQGTVASDLEGLKATSETYGAPLGDSGDLGRQSHLAANEIV